MSKIRPSYMAIGIKCQACKKVFSSKSINKFVLGYIIDDKYIDLCTNCSKIFENIPDYIPQEQGMKYLEVKINEK